MVVHPFIFQKFRVSKLETRCRDDPGSRHSGEVRWHLRKWLFANVTERKIDNDTPARWSRNLVARRVVLGSVWVAWLGKLDEAGRLGVQQVANAVSGCTEPASKPSRRYIVGTP